MNEADLGRWRRWYKANRDQKREYDRRRYEARGGGSTANQRRRVEVMRSRIDAIKLECGCVDCGFKGHPAALDFDHLPGTAKTTKISSMLNHSWSTVEAEIAKCQVVCANCHRIRTAERGYSTNRRAVVVMPSLFEAEAS